MKKVYKIERVYRLVNPHGSTMEIFRSKKLAIQRKREWEEWSKENSLARATLRSLDEVKAP